MHAKTTVSNNLYSILLEPFYNVQSLIAKRNFNDKKLKFKFQQRLSNRCYAEQSFSRAKFSSPPTASRVLLTNSSGKPISIRLFTCK